MELKFVYVVEILFFAWYGWHPMLRHYSTLLAYGLNSPIVMVEFDILMIFGFTNWNISCNEFFFFFLIFLKVCKFFLEAVEKKQYGWFWSCPNGSTCHYRHALPPGYILKSQMKALLQEETDNKRSIEEEIENQVLLRAHLAERKSNKLFWSYKLSKSVW